MLSSQCCYRNKITRSSALPSIIKIIDSHNDEHLGLAVKILSNLSSEGRTEPFISDPECISKLVKLLDNIELPGSCLMILRNLCRSQESRVAIAETHGSFPSIAELLDSGSRDGQEHAATILLYLCSCSSEYCHLVMMEGVIPALVNASINGTTTARENARTLLNLLRDFRHDGDPPEGPCTVRSNSDRPKDSRDSYQLHRGNQLSSSVATFLKRRINIFSKHKSLALFSRS